MRVCSFLPAATEILFALGLGDGVVGVTHECDYPPEARRKRVLVRPRIQAADSAAIDRSVAEHLAQGESLYAVDAAALRELAPDLVITQDLCQVCAVSPNDLSAVLDSLPQPPQVLCFSPHSLSDVWHGMNEIGVACDKVAQAHDWIAGAERRIASIRDALRGVAQPRVACIEWLDPLYVAGHWMPEIIETAGGVDALGRPGQHSVRVTWDQFAASQPEVVFIAPCGFSLEGAVAEFYRCARPVDWTKLPAVRNGQVFALDANSYTSRGGPRLVDAIEILGHLLHPDRVAEMHPAGAKRLSGVGG